MPRFIEMIRLVSKDIEERARKNLEEGEKWHKKTNVREIVFGFNDGSISILALLAGVTGGALAQNQIIVAGISGVVAGAISMGIGAYISSKSEIEHHRSEITREMREIEQMPKVEREEVRQIYRKKAHFTEKELDIIVDRIASDKEAWLDTMMKEELGLFEERFERPTKLGFVMLIAFLAGGSIPIIPFFILQPPLSSLTAAAILTFASLFIVGLWKTTFTERYWLASGLEMVAVGVLATVVPYIIGDILLSMWLSRLLG